MEIHVNMIITIFIVKIKKSLKAHLGLFGGKRKKKADFESLKGKGGKSFSWMFKCRITQRSCLKSSICQLAKYKMML